MIGKVLNSGAIGGSNVSNFEGAKDLDLIKDTKLFSPVASMDKNGHEKFVTVAQRRGVREIFRDANRGSGQKLPQVFVPAIGDVGGVGFEFACTDTKRKPEFTIFKNKNSKRYEKN